MNNIFKKEKGFTLLEMLITVVIVTIAVLGTYQAILKYTKNTQLERESFIASYLCQEGIEFIKNMRDTNWLQGLAWDAGFGSCLTTDGCEGGPNGLGSWEETKMVIDHISGFYKYITPVAGDIPTSFSRRIQVSEPTAYEMDIIVTVYWGNNTMVVKENLFNWK